MKLSKKTIEIFKYFSNISPSILVRKGNVLRARNGAKNILTKAVLDESFPEEFTLYSIPEFLKTINLFNEPDIDFKDTHMVINEGAVSVRYMYSASELYTTFPDDSDYNPANLNWSMKLSLDEADLANIKKASSVLNLNVISFTQDGIVVFNDKNRDSNNFKMKYESELVYSGDSPTDFEINFPTESFDVYAGNYELDFFCSRRSGVKLTNVADDLTVWLASNPSSRI